MDYYRLGVDAVAETLASGVAELCAAHSITPDEIGFAVVGLPGYGEVSADVAVLDALPRAAFGHDRYLCVNDMVCGWAGSLAATDGINVIGGTGSMTYGERRGESARVGGWGELFGDEGSGYWIATQGLNAFTRMSDGRLPRGPLYGLLRERVGVENDLDVIGVVFTEWGKARSSIASLSLAVAEAAAAGDAVAIRILETAGIELAQLVDTTRAVLGFTETESVPVSFSGGVFSSEIVRASFGHELAALHGGYDVRAPRFAPDTGAALYAARVAGAPLSEEALGRLAGVQL